MLDVHSINDSSTIISKPRILVANYGNKKIRSTKMFSN